MDEAALRRVEDELVAWGLLERGDAGLGVTRRFRGALARAAAQLQAQEGPSPPAGVNPVARTVEVALQDYPLPMGAALGSEHRAFLVAVEVASLPEAVRSFLGI